VIVCSSFLISSCRSSSLLTKKEKRKQNERKKQKGGGKPKKNEIKSFTPKSLGMSLRIRCGRHDESGKEGEARKEKKPSQKFWFRGVFFAFGLSARAIPPT
jgi:hypothetical protein